MNYVYGGSFNPPTKAHQKIIKKIMELESCENLIILPVGDDYQKPYLASFSHRYEMLKLLISYDKHIIISDIEQKNPYQGTLKSLDILKKTYKKLSFVIGSDQLDKLHTWIDYQTLLASYPFVILQRDQILNKDIIEKQFEMVKHEFIWIPFEQDMSSTKARTDKSLRLAY